MTSLLILLTLTFRKEAFAGRAQLSSSKHTETKHIRIKQLGESDLLRSQYNYGDKIQRKLWTLYNYGDKIQRKLWALIRLIPPAYVRSLSWSLNGVNFGQR